MAAGPTPQPNPPNGATAPPQKTDSAPVQVVVVQQNPAESDRETVSKLIEGLLGSDKPDSPEPNPQARKLTLALSSHNLLIVIALLILAGGQLASIGIRLYKDNQDEKNLETLMSRLIPQGTPGATQLQQTAAAAQQAATAAQSTVEDAKKAAADADSAAASAQRAALALERADIPNTSLALQALLVGALRNSPSPSPGTVYVPIPTPGPTPAPAPPPPSPVFPVKLPALPKISIIPCSKDFKTADNLTTPPSDPCNAANAKPQSTQLAQQPQAWEKTKALGPIQVEVKYHNTESKMDLVILDIQAFLTTENGDHGTFGLLGICPSPKTSGWQSPLPSGGYYTSDPFDLSIDQFWNRAERDKAKQEWTKGAFLTVCTTFRAADSAPILNRTVFPIIPDGPDNPAVVQTPVDNVQYFVLQ
jgi:hypothetical protein